MADSYARMRVTSTRPQIPTAFGRPVWVLAGQVTILLAFMLGFGVVESIRPNLTTALLLVGLSAFVALAPKGHAGTLVVSVSVVAFVAWWIASATWTFDVAGWRTSTPRGLTLVLSMVVVLGLLPLEEVRRGLVAACQLAIAYTVLFTVANPGEGMSHADGNPGWTASFDHKNSMAPFMVFAIVVVVSLDRNVVRRRVTVLVAVALIVLSQSTTMLIVGTVVGASAMLITLSRHLDVKTRMSLVLVGLAVTVFVGTSALYYAPSLLEARGKDLTFTGRTEIWAGVIDAIADRPWSGYGIGGVWINPSAEPTRSILRPLGFVVFHAHNGYLELLLTLGVVGLVLYAVIAIGAFRQGARALRRNSPFGTVIVLFVVQVVLTSVSEVNTSGMWLAMLCGFHTLGLRLSFLAGDISSGRDQFLARPSRAAGSGQPVAEARRRV